MISHMKQLLTAAVFLGWSSICGAEEQGWLGTAQIHGFLSQGFVLTSANNFYGDSESGSLDFTEAGVNLSVRPYGPLMLAAQGVFRRVGRINPNEFRLDYALADYAFWSGTEGRAGIMLGRVKNPLGFYNETRDVAFTRPTIFLPQSIYFDRTRNLGLASDGLQLYGEYSTAWGDWFLRLGAGWPNGTNDKEFERLTVSANFPGQFEPKFSYIGRLSYELQGGLIRLAVTSAQVTSRYDPEVNNPFQAGEVTLTPVIFSAQYDGEKFSLTGEYALRFIQLESFGQFLPNQSVTSESYYLQGSYRLLPSVELVARYDVFFADRDDTSGRKFAALTGRPRHTRFARDWTVGIRWDITNAFMVRAEYHNVDGTGWLAASESPDLSERQRHWHMFALLASFRF